MTALVGINPNTGDWQVVERYVYDAYGTATIYVQSLTDPSDQNWTTASAASSVGNTILFASESLDPATGLYCDGVRWYDASVGTFVSRDPLGLSAGSNTYQYCGSNPISNTDPSGMDDIYSQNVNSENIDDYPSMSLADPSFSGSSGWSPTGAFRADDGDSERGVRRRRPGHQPAPRRRWRFRTASSATAARSSASFAPTMEIQNGEFGDGGSIISQLRAPTMEIQNGDFGDGGGLVNEFGSVLWHGTTYTAGAGERLWVAPDGSLVRSWGGGRFEEHTLYCEVHLGPGAGRPQQAGWSLNDPYLMLCHPFATIGGAGLCLCHGAAMIANAATFHQITALNLYVQTIVTQNGGMYGVANFFAHVGVYSGYAAIGLWLWASTSASTTVFAAGTPLLTPDGAKPIEEFKVGDLVLSAPEDDPNGPVAARRVEKVFQRLARIVELRVGGQAIRTTHEHPFYVQGKGWTKAAALSAGDLLKSNEGHWVPSSR